MGIVNFYESAFIAQGCPVADGGSSCCHGCGGGWPGTRVTTESMTKAVSGGTIVPDRLGCQPLVARARIGLVEMEEIRTTIADLSFNWTC